MAKTCSTVILAAALNVIHSNVSKLCICKGAPVSATNAETSANNAIAVTTCSSGALALGDSSVSGLKIDVSAFSNLPCISTGTADTLCLISSGATGLIYWQTTFANQVVSSTANLVNTSTFIIRISDAT